VRDSTPSFNLLGIKLPEQVTPDSPQPDAARSIGQSSLAALGLSALGIVIGDIGTSPLYTLKTVLALSGSTPAPDQQALWPRFLNIVPDQGPCHLYDESSHLIEERIIISIVPHS
jgi:K+ potassium transporter